MREPENQASNHAQDSIAVSQPDQWYRAILDSSADGILVTDMRGRVREGNQALSRMIGLSLEEIIGRRTADIFPPAAGKEIARHLQKLRRVRQGRIEVAAFHLVQPDGHTIDIEINFALLKEGEEPTAIVGVVRDVTARKQQEAELRLLQRINNALISAPDLDEVLQTIAEGMVDTFRYAGSMIFLSDEEYNHLVLRAVVHNSETVAQAEKLLGYPLLGHKFTPEKDEIYHRLYHDRQPILSTDIADHLARLTSHKTRKPAARAIARLIRARVKSIMLVPLVVNDVVRGTLVLAARRHLHEEDATRVQAFATQASIAIEKAQLLEIERRRASHTESLAAVAQQITADLHLTDTLSRVTDSALAVLDADRVAIFLMGRKTGSVYCAHSIGLSKEYVETINRRYREVPGGRVLSTRQAVQVVDILNDPRITAVRQTMIEEGFRTYTALPMLVHGEIIGSLVFYRDTVHPFSSEELALGQSFAQQAAAAIENARLFSETERRLQEISTLYEASQACLSVSDQGSLLSKIVAAAARASGATMGSVMLRDEQQGEYV
ncbi:MAG: GAF domain-containing protein, partial [Chloroflexota bacterium]|nr:GAF domain-containing protein [Chloroflexota bacterium]